MGKSRLAQELCDRAGARHCFYQAPRRPQPDAIAEFVLAVRQSSLPAAESFEGASYTSWPAALRAAAQGASASDPVIIVIDELPYLTEQDTGFAADLQAAWDRVMERSAVLLVCIGSDVRMMEELVTPRSSLHGRPTSEMLVAPLSPTAVAGLTRSPDAASGIDRYLVVGGFPLLAASWPEGAALEAFLTDALATDATPFVTTALRILTSEFEEHLQASRVIRAIGAGETAHGRIQSRSGVKGSTLSDALAVLVDRKSLVERQLPYAVPPSRTPAHYLIADPYLRFWLRFVGPHLEELARGRSDLVVARILRDWSTYRGRAVEPLIRGALERLLVDPDRSGSLAGARHVGSWWRRDHSVEVDLVGGDAPDPTRVIFIGTVKWHEANRLRTTEIRRLAGQRADVPGAGGAKLVAVSRSGIEDSAEVDAAFGPDDLLAAW